MSWPGRAPSASSLSCQVLPFPCSRCSPVPASCLAHTPHRAQEMMAKLHSKPQGKFFCLGLSRIQPGPLGRHSVICKRQGWEAGEEGACGSCAVWPWDSPQRPGASVVRTDSQTCLHEQSWGSGQARPNHSHVLAGGWQAGTTHACCVTLDRYHVLSDLHSPLCQHHLDFYLGLQGGFCPCRT